MSKEVPVSGRSTSSVQQTTLRNVSVEQDMYEKVWGWVGCWQYCTGVLSFSLSHVLCEEQGSQPIVKTTINSGHTPAFVDQPIIHVAGEIVNSSSMLISLHLPCCPAITTSSQI